MNIYVFTLEGQQRGCVDRCIHTCHMYGWCSKWGDPGIAARVTSHFPEERGVLRDPGYTEGGGRSAHGNNQLVVLEGEGAGVAGGGALA